MRTASAVSTVPIGPDEAMRLWTDVDRWPSFVEGFARRLELSADWPAKGARVVWESNPDGRGRVTETVHGERAAQLLHAGVRGAADGHPDLPGGARERRHEVALVLDYELTSGGPLRALADAIFIRRALRDSLRRTLFRFEVEAEDEAELR